MPQTRNLLRALAWLIASLCVTVLIPAGAIRADQYLLRRKAEHLLADVKSLEMRRSSYHDARQVIDRWKDRIHQSGPCQPNRCDVEIAVGDFSYYHFGFFVHHPRLMQVWRVLGGRPATVDGFIRVRNGVVWGKGIRAIFASYSAGYGEDVDLVGRMGSGSPGFVSPLHPEYDVGVHRSGAGAYADFTPYADPAEVNRLMDIDFSCLTRWHFCQTVVEIAPAAWHQATAENEERMARNRGELSCSPAVVRVLARESRRAVIGEVSRVWLYPRFLDHPNAESQDDSSFAMVKILLKDELKQCNLNSLAALQDYTFRESLPVKEKVGDRFILFFRYNEKLYSDIYSACGLLPATKENLEAVRRGAAEDWANRDDQF